MYDSHNSLFITGCFLWKDTNSNTGNGQFRSRKGAFTLNVLISILFPADTVKDLDLGMLYAMRNYTQHLLLCLSPIIVLL